ncbi:MAG TPA: hypothetical protein VJH67_01215 [Candidatus Paceibacterota bacterium]
MIENLVHRDVVIKREDVEVLHSLGLNFSMDPNGVPSPERIGLMTFIGADTRTKMRICVLIRFEDKYWGDELVPQTLQEVFGTKCYLLHGSNLDCELRGICTYVLDRPLRGSRSLIYKIANKFADAFARGMIARAQDTLMAVHG